MNHWVDDPNIGEGAFALTRGYVCVHCFKNGVRTNITTPFFVKDRLTDCYCQKCAEAMGYRYAPIGKTTPVTPVTIPTGISMRDPMGETEFIICKSPVYNKQHIEEQAKRDEMAFFSKPNDSLNCICGCRRAVCTYHRVDILGRLGTTLTIVKGQENG